MTEISVRKKSFPHIVIVGGGAGGLILATQLGRKLGQKKVAHITLVDAQLTHIWKPLLHEVAAGSLNPYEDELNYFAQAQRNGFAFQPGRMTGVDRDKRLVKLDDMQDETGMTVVESREIAYDYLIIAIGSTANDFGTPGAQKNCIYLDTRREAEKLHRTLLNHYYRAKARGEDNSRLSIAIVGAGATGVELAAEMHHAAGVLTSYGLDEIDPANVSITLIEAADRILPALSERISKLAYLQLKHIGVTVLTDEKVIEIDDKGIKTASGMHINASIRVWSAGIKAPECLRNIAGLELDRGNTLIVDRFLRTTLDERIFAIGDCASCTVIDKKLGKLRVPPRAQTAYQQAQWLSDALPILIEGKSPKIFSYQDRGSLISLSTRSTVGQLMGNLTGSINIEGKIARLMYLSLYRLHQATLYGWPRMIIFILKDILGRSTGPKLKLH